MVKEKKINIFQLIKGRRSIRRFKKDKLSNTFIAKVLESGRWAPSGLNNQPWKFKILEGNQKNELAEFTKYSYIVKQADKLILVFLDQRESYHRDKDLMAIGACIQNMLLYIHAQGVGACWLGEIINQKDKIIKHLKIKSSLEFVAAVAVGKPVSFPKRRKRKNIKKLIIK